MSYVIFSIDNWWDLHTLAKFTRHMDTLKSMGKLQGSVVPLVGCYNDQPEMSFICTEYDFDTGVRGSGYVDKQESFLYVSEEKQMPAWLKDRDGNKLKSGRLEKSNAVSAMDTGSWTYRADINQFFTMS